MSFLAFLGYIVVFYCMVFPCFYNLPDYLFKKLLSVEKRATTVSGRSFDPFSLSDDELCIRFFKQVVSQDNHPLWDFLESLSHTD